MLEVKITSWTGFPEAPTVVALSESQNPPEPQAGTRPTLRLIRGGKS